MKRCLNLKFITVVIAVMLSTSIFTGCGSSETAGNSAKPGPVPAASTTAPVKDDFGKKDPTSYSATLNMWAHTPAQPTFMIQNYNKLYPNVKINLTIIPAAEQQQKIMNAVASGANVPDIFTARTQFVRLLVEADGYYANLLAAPYNAKDIAAQTEQYVIGVGSDASGALKALSWQCPVGGIYYRRSFAKQFFGNDDPDFMSKKFATNDELLKTAREIKEKSGGSVKFITHYWQLQQLIRGGGKNGFVVDGKLNIDPILEKYFDFSKTFFDENLDARTKPDTPNQYAAMQKGQLFAYIYPTWGLNYNLMPNHPDMSSDWGLAHGPNSYTSGGTYMGIYAKTKRAEEAWTFVNYVFTNQDFIYNYAINLGDYVSNKNIQQKIGGFSADQTKDMPIFKYMANQNVYKFFNEELAKGVNTKIFSKYDETFIKYLDNACEAYAEGKKTKDAAWKQFKEDCKMFAPELIVD